MRRDWNARLRGWSRAGVGRAIGFAVVLAFVVLRFWDPQPLEALRLQTFDTYQQLKPRNAEAHPVVIVDIDEPSLAAFGQWPWPRTRIADLVDRLSAAGAVAIAIDAIFAEPDRMSPDALARATPMLDDDTRSRLASLPSNDALLATAIARSRVVLGQSGVGAARSANEAAAASGPRTSIAVMGGNPSRFVMKVPALLTNVPELEAAAAGRGILTLLPDADGRVRRVPAIARAGDDLVPTLAIDLLRVATGEQTILVKTQANGVESLVIGGVEVPTDDAGRLWVHFARHSDARYVSARDVLGGTLDPNAIAGRLVIIGTSAIGLLDTKTTPISEAMPGVEVHAQLLETILDGAQLIRPDYATGVEIVLALLAGALMVVLVPVLGAQTVLILGFALAASLAALSWSLFARHNMLIDVAYPMLSSLAVFGVMVFVNYSREERQRREIRDAFGRYLAPNVVERLARDPGQLTLGGETRELTILFADVRGFTRIAEGFRDDPQGLIQLMNRFLTPLSDEIIAREGTIDKYMGDAIMAFWNAPVDVANHAMRAGETALAMQAAIAGLDRVRKAEADAAGVAFQPLALGIGLNTGMCVVGNMGSTRRFDYSVMGDAVNIASRMEGQTKAFGAPILMGGATAAAIGDQLAIVDIDRVRVKGKTEPEEVWALLGDAACARTEAFRQDVVRLRAVLTAYRQRDWPTAHAAASDLQATCFDPTFAAIADVYARRIASYEINPPPTDWDGVFAAVSK